MAVALLMTAPCWARMGQRLTPTCLRAFADCRQSAWQAYDDHPYTPRLELCFLDPLWGHLVMECIGRVVTYHFGWLGVARFWSPEAYQLSCGLVLETWNADWAIKPPGTDSGLVSRIMWHHRSQTWP